MLMHGPSSAFTFDRKETGSIPYSDRAEPRLRVAGLAVESRAISAPTWRRATETTLVASTESWETVRALTPESALQAEIDRRKLLLAGRAAETRRRARRRNWCSRPTSS